MHKNFKLQISNFKKNRFDHFLFGFEHSQRNWGGFTLLELLIAIAVIGGLAGILMTTYPATQRRARDTERKSDIKQYQTAMELFANRSNGSYPVLSGNVAGSCATLGLTQCPDDPQGGANHYQVSSSVSSYVLWTQLEVSASPPAAWYFVVCSTGNAGHTSMAPSTPICPAGLVP